MLSRRRLSVTVLLTTAVAMLLTLVLATPANAAVPVLPATSVYGNPIVNTWRIMSMLFESGGYTALLGDGGGVAAAESTAARTAPVIGRIATLGASTELAATSALVTLPAAVGSAIAGFTVTQVCAVEANRGKLVDKRGDVVDPASVGPTTPAFLCGLSGAVFPVIPGLTADAQGIHGQSLIIGSGVSIGGSTSSCVVRSQRIGGGYTTTDLYAAMNAPGECAQLDVDSTTDVFGGAAPTTSLPLHAVASTTYSGSVSTLNAVLTGPQYWSQRGGDYSTSSGGVEVSRLMCQRADGSPYAVGPSTPFPNYGSPSNISVSQREDSWSSRFDSGSTTSLHLALAGDCGDGHPVGWFLLMRPVGNGNTAIWPLGATNGYVRPGGTTHGTLETTISCKPVGADDSQAHYVTASAAVTVVNGSPVGVPDVTCPDGEVVGGDGGVTFKADDGTTTDVVPKSDPRGQPGSDSATSVDQFQKDHPECFTAAGQQSCVLRLYKRAGTELQFCGSIGQQCEDWATDPLYRDHYTCRYESTTGGWVETVDIRFCSVYRAPRIGPQPNVDPITGNLVDPATPPDPRTDPGTPPGTDPGSTTPGSDSSVGSNCEAPSWVDLFTGSIFVKALKCLLIPDPAVQRAAVTRMSDALRSTAPGKYVEFVGGLAADVPTLSGGCRGPLVDLQFDWTRYLHVGTDFKWGIRGYPFSACDPPIDGLALTFRLLLDGIVGFATLVGISSPLSGAFGFPALKIGGRGDS